MVEEIVHQTQPDPFTCVNTCLSMVTGIPVERFTEQFGDQGMTHVETLRALIEAKIFPVVIQESTYYPFPYLGKYLVAVPSLNILGKHHQIVVVLTAEGYKVYDPNMGREGRNFYKDEDVTNGKMSWATVIYLDGSILK